MNAAIPNPYLNPAEHPSTALPRLLQLLQLVPPAMPETAPINLTEVQLADAISVQARQAFETVTAGIIALLPLGDANQTDLHPVLTHLNHEAEAMQQLASTFQALAANFYARPLYQSSAEEKALAMIKQANTHYYYPLGRFLQALPGDITNVARLSPQQGVMAAALARMAEQACQTLENGLAAIEKLIAIAGGAVPPEALPEMGALLAYLRGESGFMQESAMDYRDAANNLVAGGVG